MKFPNDSELRKEWKTLPHHPSPRCGGARKYFFSALNNPGKNRYPDVLPFERTLVRLHTGDHCSYINANFIQTVPQQRPRYIACQAPLPHTFTDFWIMVWENNTPVIVMLTRLMERRRVKAHCYWPGREGEEERFGDIRVVLKQEVEQEKLVFRLFDIKRGDEVREVLHIHYQEWPDYGAPLSCKIIGNVISAMSSYREAHQKKYGLEEPAMVTVHCSAGIGRAGTFIAINAYRERKEAEVADACGNISVKDIVEDLRQQRMGMVQSKEQYCFIYRAIREFEFSSDDDPVDESPEPCCSVSLQRSACIQTAQSTAALPSIAAPCPSQDYVHMQNMAIRSLAASVPNLSVSSSSSSVYLQTVDLCSGVAAMEMEEDSDFSGDEFMDEVDDDEDVGVINFSSSSSSRSHDHSDAQFRSMSYNVGLNINLFTRGVHSPLPTPV
mmetsp:Transcript_17103/g.66610  ORF Transcript_17103/g.66610 Transcript_17103/m.66610 type:complete len:440 (+) Transcript_17103:154-1473(+)|eukprot:CAMPEP_0114627920 /NCGR_PEP_ID=MMETSP0168-20121206/12549_1 /TAXON_ID=95228 ORGANISM="Vannella sp., Strain DIVA3 517/6/12" /NCGR_SAMPLE_ID=MMETSP0168 /ASSEMBLY_ACC=CAM_ASM_000044 /LENGTH=439 /DNA_ID=CAMNT_0001839277 /DNA_START=146 /DNA_END=1465 /DNA_ORIENTATION=-